MPAFAYPSAFRRLFDEIGTVDAVGIEERVAKYATRSIKKGSKAQRPETGRFDGRSDNPRGKGHARKDSLALSQGPASARGCGCALRRGRLRISLDGAACEEARRRHSGEGGVGGDGLSIGADAFQDAPGRSEGSRRGRCRRDRHGDQPRSVSGRRVRKGAGRDFGRPRGLRRSSPQGDIGGERAGNLRRDPRRAPFSP